MARMEATIAKLRRTDRCSLLRLYRVQHDTDQITSLLPPVCSLLVLQPQLQGEMACTADSLLKGQERRVRFASHRIRGCSNNCGCSIRGCVKRLREPIVIDGFLRSDEPLSVLASVVGPLQIFPNLPPFITSSLIFAKH